MTSLLRNERCGILFWNEKKAPELSAPSGIGAADFAGAGTPLKFNSVEFPRRTAVSFLQPVLPLQI